MIKKKVAVRYEEMLPGSPGCRRLLRNDKLGLRALLKKLWFRFTGSEKSVGLASLELARSCWANMRPPYGMWDMGIQGARAPLQDTKRTSRVGACDEWLSEAP